MIRNFSVSLKIILVLFVLQITVITLILSQHGHSTLTQYDKNEREKADMITKMLLPVVSLQMSLGFTNAMEDQLNTMMMNNEHVMQLIVTQNDATSIYRFERPGYNTEDRFIEVVAGVPDPYTGETIGTVTLYYSTVNIEQLRTIDENFRFKTIAIMLAAALLFILLLQKILSPLNRLSRKISGYNPDNGSCDLKRSSRRDEVARIQNSVIGMVERIRDYSRRLQDANTELEARVKERTEALEESNRKLHELSLTDALTQLPNRRRFVNDFNSVWNIYMREQKPLSLIVADIDHFKKINDSYGHEVGDQVLREIAEVFRSHLRRETDLAIRYGGEEFVLLLPATPEAEAIECATTLRRRIHSRSYAAEQIVVTVSFGIHTMVPEPETPRQELFNRADQALYRAKRCGRDRIVHYSQIGQPCD